MNAMGPGHVKSRRVIVPNTRGYLTLDLNIKAYITSVRHVVQMINFRVGHSRYKPEFVNRALSGGS